MTLSTKIKEVRNHILNVTQSEFAKKLGFSRTATISDYEKGKRLPDITTLRKIAELGSVTIDWLISDEDLYKPSGSEDKPENKDYINVSVYKANILDIHTDKPKSLPIEDFLIPKKHYQKNTLAIRFEGVSMSPTILNGAILGIDREDKNLTSGKLLALWLKHEGLTIRRVFVHPGRIELIPDNATFPTTTINIKDIDDSLIVGSVTWIFQGL